MGYSVPRYKRGTSERLANALVALFVHSMSIVRESTRNSRQGDIETHFFFFCSHNRVSSEGVEEWGIFLFTFTRT